MVWSRHRILTTHVGSLPRPADLMALYKEQVNAGIDVINDGQTESR